MEVSTQAFENGHDPSMHRRRHGTRTRKGRRLVLMMLILFWITYVAHYALTYFDFGSDPRLFRANVIVSAIWTTFLFIMIWRRQQWARYALLALLSIALIISSIGIYDSMTRPRATTQQARVLPLVAFSLNVAVNALTFFLLLKSKSIRHLTSYNALA